MKKMHQFILMASAAFLAACSSMDIDDDVALSENFPSDFKAEEYLAINPQVRNQSIRQYASKYNANLKDSLGNDAYTALASSDEKAFTSDTAVLHKIYVEIGGRSENDWAAAWRPLDSIVNDTIRDSAAIVSFSLRDLAEKTNLEVFVDSIVKGADNKIVTIIGKTDSTAATSTEYAVTTDTTVATGFYIRKTNYGDAEILEIKSDTIQIIPTELTGADLGYVKTFNFIGVADDYGMALAAPIDTFAVTYHYVLYGKSHGWAYRPCKESERPTLCRLNPSLQRRAIATTTV